MNDTKPVKFLAMVAYLTMFLPLLPAENSFLSLFPKESVAVVTIADIAKINKEFAGTNLYELLHEPEMVRFFQIALESQGVSQAAATGSERLKIATGLSLEDILAILDGELSLALIGLPFGSEPLDLAMILESKAHMDRTTNLLDAIAKKIPAEKGSFQVNGTPVSYWKGLENALYFAVLKDRCLFATTESRIRQMIANLGSPQNSLAENPKFQKFYQKVGNTAAFFAYCDERLLTRFSRQMPTALQRWWHGLGFSDWQNIGIGFSIRKKQFLSQLYITTSQDLRGFNRCLAFDQITSAVGKLIPEKANAFATFRLDLAKVWQELTQSWRQAEPREFHATMEGLEKFEKAFLGFRVEELLKSLGPDVTVFHFPADGLVPQIVTVITLQDAAFLMKTLETLADIVGYHREEKKYEHRIIHYFAPKPQKEGAADIATNESSAIGFLRNLATSQAQYQSQAQTDQDSDGTGEFAFLQELAGTSQRRSSTDSYGPPANPTFIAPVFGETAAKNRGIATRYGYHFYLYLPGLAKEAIGEIPGDPTNMPEFANAQECKYVCYAWPVEYGKTGRRIFVIDQSGEVVVADNDGGRYSGSRKPGVAVAYPAGTACFEESVGHNRTGNDGQVWLPCDMPQPDDETSGEGQRKKLVRLDRAAQELLKFCLLSCTFFIEDGKIVISRLPQTLMDVADHYDAQGPGFPINALLETTWGGSGLLAYVDTRPLSSHMYHTALALYSLGVESLSLWFPYAGNKPNLFKTANLPRASTILRHISPEILGIREHDGEIVVSCATNFSPEFWFTTGLVLDSIETMSGRVLSSFVEVLNLYLTVNQQTAKLITDEKFYEAARQWRLFRQQAYFESFRMIAEQESLACERRYQEQTAMLKKALAEHFQKDTHLAACQMEGDWKFAEGILSAENATSSGGWRDNPKPWIVFGDMPLADYVLEFQARGIQSQLQVLFHWQKPFDGSPKYTHIAFEEREEFKDKWVTLKFKVHQDHITYWLEGKLFVVSSSITSGLVGFALPQGSAVQIRNIQLKVADQGEEAQGKPRFPALYITCQPSAESVQVGDSIVYAIGVRNEGNERASDVTLEAQLPLQVEFITARGATFKAAPGKAIFGPLVLDPGESLKCQVTVKAIQEGSTTVSLFLSFAEIKGKIVVKQRTHIVKE